MRNEPERRGDDEIDLFELLGGLWKQKLLIILTAAIVTGGAVAYALLATPIYEAKVVVQPPSQSNISQLNYGRGGDSGLAMLSVKDVYDVYLRNLQSESLKREFFRKVFLPSLPEDERNGSQDDLYGRMNGVLMVAVTSKDTPSRYYIMASLPVAEQAAKWVVQYAQMAGEQAKREVTRDVRGDGMVKANNLEQQITAARESTRKQREDQIVHLTEALRVADSIGLEKPPIISNSLTGEVSAGMDGSLTYMRGSKALSAEIENLRNRTSDDPFIPKLRQREEAVSFYRSLEVDPGVIEVYRQDGSIELPDKPVKPKKLFIVVLGLVAGLMLGVLIALFRHMWLSASHLRVSRS
ncbi:LPS O-antigen chain length determinant protein WzzB [Pseudomonas sp. V1]|uniref:LPS O-antigen chain length determinant protein WzzB n=1 Tax=Pseudomonas arcuscaelestis TaxID=2710591 RepID=UPI00193FF09F|nr:Wzz/FepE/Etk N-terminal domain-containing protein [Pseudomonas arcuscaelestis]MBM3106690.1 LPS O-antigen chain length determinant protein WzzB [Pseudomonas arcuscaelestis]